jgi:TIR domain
MAGKIFINYRRDDSIGTAGRLHDRLAQTFGRKNLFMDVDHIPAGVDFVKYLHSQVAGCDVFLAVIGPNWLDAKDDDGCRRFDNPDDFVTIEIAAALARNIRVIPVLIDGAYTPKAERLPDSVKPLVRRNAVELRNAHFGRDAEALTEKIKEALSDKPVRVGGWRAAAGVVVALLLLGWIGLFATMPISLPWAVQPDTRQQAEKERLVAAKAEEERKAKAAAEAEAKRDAEEAEQQRLAAAKAEEERKAKAAAEAEAKRKAEEAEQQRLAAAKAEEERKAKAATEAEAKRKAEEAEQQRQATAKAEEERKAKAAAEAEAKRKAEEAEQQRQATEEERRKQAAPGGVSKFDGNWLVHRARCAGRPALNFQIHLENGKISGRFEPKEISALPGSRPPIIGSISASGGINFNHHRVNNAGEIEHANAYYTGTFRGNSASGTFSTGYCNGTFTMART